MENNVEIVSYRRSSKSISAKVLEDQTQSEDDEEKSKMDGGWGWVVVFGSFMLNFIVDGITLSLGSLNEPIITASENKISEDQIGFVNALLTGITLIVGPLASELTDKFGFRAVMGGGTIVTVIGFGFTWIYHIAIDDKPDIFIFIFIYALLGGIGFGLIFSPSIVIVGLYFEKRRSLATGLTVCGTGVGTMVFPILITELAKELGWREAILIQTCFVLIGFIFVGLMRPPPYFKLKNNKEKTEISRDSFWKRNSLYFCSPTFMLLAISGGILMLGFYMPYAFLQDRATSLKIDRDAGAYLISSIGTSNVFGRILIGIISDRFPGNSLLISNACLTICGVSTLLSPFIKAYPLLMIYCVIFGATIGGFATLRSVVIQHLLGKEKFNYGFGLSLLFMGIFTIGGPSTGGLLIKLTKEYDYTFYFAGFIIATSAVISYPLQRVHNWETIKKFDNETQASKGKSISNTC